MSSIPLRHGIFLPPFHPMDESPAACIDRDLELMQWLDRLGFHEAWIGEHHSAGWEIISSPELFIAVAAERTRSLQRRPRHVRQARGGAERGAGGNADGPPGEGERGVLKSGAHGLPGQAGE